ncbi:hypothetical protein Tco_0526742 [Tanacetum coccineum]
MTEEMGVDIDARLGMRHKGAKGLVVFTSHALRRLFDIRRSLVRELMLEFFSTYRFDDLILDLDTDVVLSFQLGGARRTMSWRQFILAMGLHTIEEIDTNGFMRYWAESSSTVASKGDLRGYWEVISSSGDFLTTIPSYLLIRDPFRRLCHRLIAHTIAKRGQAPEKVTSTDLYFLRSMDQEAVNLPYLLAHCLFRHAEGRKQEAQMSGGYFIAPCCSLWPVSDRAEGLTVIPDALVVDEGAPAIPAPVQAPQPPPAASPTKNLP